MTEFFRFPHTCHLLWLGEGEPRGDKVLTPPEANLLLENEIIIEEKLDGAKAGECKTLADYEARLSGARPIDAPPADKDPAT